MKKAIFKVSLVSALLGTALTVSAASLTQTQIDAILGLLRSFGADESVVANVETSMKGGTPTTQPTEWCHTFNVNLKIGDQNDDVTNLDRALIKEGFLSSDEVFQDARTVLNFDEITAAAVTGFQEKYKSEILTPVGLAHGTGYVGPSTRKKLNQLYGCTKPKPRPICTQDAKQCPDGSYVSRTGPKCEFAACPRASSDPYITSLSVYSGPIGTKLEINGRNFIGFEGDLDAVFVRSDGKEIPLYGGTWYPGYGGEVERGKIMIVTVQSYCPSGSETGRYSGIISPCQTVQATPGVYKVYVTAWGKKSNEVSFTIQ